MPPPPPRLPAHALRDVLGFARLLYAAESQDGGDPERLLALGEAGRLLALSLGQATKYEPESLAFRAAPGNATKGLDKLAGAVSAPELVRLVEVARARVLKPER